MLTSSLIPPLQKVQYYKKWFEITARMLQARQAEYFCTNKDF